MQKELDEITAKRQKKGKKEEEKTIEEKSILHVENPLDYQVGIFCAYLISYFEDDFYHRL